jgi:hypothetical protein
MKRIRICTLWLTFVGKLILDKYEAQIPKKFSHNLEHQRKIDLEMHVNGVN